MGGRAQRRKPRAARTATYRRPIADPSEALAALHEAKGRRVLAGIGAGEEHAEHIAALDQAVTEAQAAVDACFEDIVFNALPGDEFEALMGEHPPTPEDDEKGLTHHDETFLPALLAASCTNGWTVEDWEAELAECTLGDRRELRETVTHVNTRTWSQQIPKG